MRLLNIPLEPLPRLRMLTLGLVLLTSLVGIATSLFTPAPLPLRVAAALAALALGAWCWWGYQRDRFPAMGWLLEAALLFVVTAATIITFRGVAYFGIVLLFRTLYAPRREVPWLILGYLAARVASLAFAVVPPPYAVTSSTAGLQVAFLVVVALLTHAVVTAAHRHAAVQQALKRSEERYRVLAGATRDVVYEWDVATGAVEWTESLTSVFGFPLPPAGSDASWWMARVHPDDRPAFDDAGRHLLSDFVDLDYYRYRVQRPNGEYATVAATAVVQRSADGTPIRVVGSVRDVTAVQQLEEQLRESQKMEAVGKLAAGVAHDFNNLLMVMEGHLFMVREKVSGVAEVDEHLDRAHGAIERATGVVAQLLAFSRQQQLVPRVLNLNAVIDDVVQMVRPSMGSDVAIITNLDPLLSPVLADAGQVGQVLVNLALNARDAMPDGGRLTFVTDNVTLGEGSALATRTRLPAGDYVRLTVNDDGTGMDSATRARAFEPFFTTKGPGKGTGLGLSTAYGIVRQSAGDIWTDSTPGAGTTFTVLLPVAAQPADPNGTAITPTPARPAKGSPRVLVVEDSDDVRSFVREALAREHYDVVTAVNGLDALSVVEGRVGEFDAVLTDVSMPKMTGPQMMARLREARPDLPVVYMTGYADPQTLATCGTGALVLQKPLSLAKLTRALQQVMQR